MPSAQRRALLVVGPRRAFRQLVGRRAAARVVAEFARRACTAGWAIAFSVAWRIFACTSAGTSGLIHSPIQATSSIIG